jgi:hypothetical protein
VSVLEAPEQGLAKPSLTLGIDLLVKIADNKMNEQRN